MTRRERLQRRQERRAEWAGKANARSEAAFTTAAKMSEAIPFGQPVLVGHHSERCDRSYRARIHSKMDHGLAEHRKASHHDSKARGLAIALERSIFDDDPDAVERLETKVAELERACAQAKAINSAWRKGGHPRVAAEFGELIAAAAAKLLAQCPWLRMPMTTTNDRAEIRRCKQRIEAIRKQRARTDQAEQAGGLSLSEGNGWAVLTFAEKPEPSILADLRAAGFRWGKGSWHGYSAKLPESVRDLVDRAEGQRTADARKCLCSELDAYECAPCENARQASEVQTEPTSEEQAAS